LQLRCALYFAHRPADLPPVEECYRKRLEHHDKTTAIATVVTGAGVRLISSSRRWRGRVTALLFTLACRW
jgi:hypothetical protein